MYRISAISTLVTPLTLILSSSSVPVRRRCSTRRLNLKPLTSRIVFLTRRRQLGQIVEEVEAAKKRHGRLNKIVMNSVLEACVHCGDVDLALRMFHEMVQPGGCGVDTITYATILKGLGKARRIDEAFQMLESIEHGTAAGNPKLSASLIYGLLDALINAGDLRRANGLLARYGSLLLQHGGPSVLIYNLLMKGYIKSESPQAAVSLLDEMLRFGLEPDRFTYNTLIHACINCGDLEAAMKLLKEMKKKAETYLDDCLHPDNITYTTLVKGLGDANDLLSLQEIYLEMKLCDNLFIDRTAFTAVVDAMLKCGARSGALCVFGELLKRSGANEDLRPKPHLYLSMMRAFAGQGDYGMVRNLYLRLWPDSSGTISTAVQQEADSLLMEAALNAGQLDEALGILSSIVRRWKAIPWSTSGGMAAVRLEALLGFPKSILRPYLLTKVIPGEPIETIMIPFEATKPLLSTLRLRNVAMRFFKEQVVPIIDDRGSCIGLLHREDCNNLDAPLVSMMRSPPPCVTTTTSIARVVDLVLEKKFKMADGDSFFPCTTSFFVPSDSFVSDAAVSLLSSSTFLTSSSFFSSVVSTFSSSLVSGPLVSSICCSPLSSLLSSSSLVTFVSLTGEVTTEPLSFSLDSSSCTGSVSASACTSFSASACTSFSASTCTSFSASTCTSFSSSFGSSLSSETSTSVSTLTISSSSSGAGAKGEVSPMVISLSSTPFFTTFLEPSFLFLEEPVPVPLNTLFLEELVPVDPLTLTGGDFNEPPPLCPTPLLP